MVVPGDFLSHAEEFAPGPGAFEDGGDVFAAVEGEARSDARERVAGVQARRVVRLLQPGDLVYGRVRDIYEMMAGVEVEAPLARGHYYAAAEQVAFLRISEVQRAFLERFRDALRIGDLVRARVVEVKPLATYLTLKDADLGVIRAFCSRCRLELEPRGGTFVCASCGSRESRKVPGEAGAPGDGRGRGLSRDDRGPRGFGRGPRRDGGRGGRGFERRG